VEAGKNSSANGLIEDLDCRGGQGVNVSRM
jgi:hypothetical protein